MCEDRNLMLYFSSRPTTRPTSRNPTCSLTQITYTLTHSHASLTHIKNFVEVSSLFLGVSKCFEFLFIENGQLQFLLIENGQLHISQQLVFPVLVFRNAAMIIFFCAPATTTDCAPRTGSHKKQEPKKKKTDNFHQTKTLTQC